MKRYKVTCTIDAPTFLIKIEANSPEEAKEKAEEMFMNGEVEHEYYYSDLSDTDTCTATDAEEITQNNPQ